MGDVHGTEASIPEKPKPVAIGGIEGEDAISGRWIDRQAPMAQRRFPPESNRPNLGAARTVLSGHFARTSRAPFLGEDAAFSHGPYVLAALMGCPVYLMFCLREGNGHTVYFERFAERISLPRHDRQTTLDGLVNRYARRLEYYCLRAPLQFYNFYDFWAVNGDDDVREPRRREKDQVENLGRA